MLLSKKQEIGSSILPLATKMFNLKKVIKARKRINIITAVLFKLFQITLRYKEKRKDYGIEIFEYFYLPWKTDENFIQSITLILEFSLP